LKNKNKRMTNKERDNQLNYLFQSMYELSKEIRMVRGLFENYIIWKKDVKKFTKYLQKEEERKSKEREEEQAKRSRTPKADS
tara:strand:- start:420 stop:665 length:246 start_codon:yes stop_codon:yes gene_type:complete